VKFLQGEGYIYIYIYTDHAGNVLRLLMASLIQTAGKKRAWTPKIPPLSICSREISQKKSLQFFTNKNPLKIP